MNVSTSTRTAAGWVAVLNATDQAVERFLRLSGRHGVLATEVLDLYRPVVNAAGRRGTPRWLAARHLVATGGGSKIPASRRSTPRRPPGGPTNTTNHQTTPPTSARYLSPRHVVERFVASLRPSGSRLGQLGEAG